MYITGPHQCAPSRFRSIVGPTMFLYGWLKDPVNNDICASMGTPWNAVEEEDNTV